MTTTEEWAHCRDRLINIIGMTRFKKTVTRWGRAISLVMVNENCTVNEAVQTLSKRRNVSLQQIAVLKAVAAEIALHSK
jgi:hypothetical protein